MPNRSGSNYSIQSNGSRPGHSNHKSKTQECQPRGESQMEDARTSTSFQRLASTFDTLIESPEADITAINVVRPGSLSTDNNRDIPVSVQELAYSGKTRVGTSPKSLDRNHELISSSGEVHGARKARGTSEGLDTHVFQRASPTEKAWFKRQKTDCNFEEIPRLEEWATFSGEGEYNHMEFMKTINMFKEDFNIPDEYISTRLHSLFTKSAKKWYYKMIQDHGKHSWPWWKEKIIYKWANYSWRFKVENSFEEAIFNIERDRCMFWFLKPKDRLTALYPDMSDTMVHKRILRKCGGDLEHVIRRSVLSLSLQKIILMLWRTSLLEQKIGRNWYKPPMDNKTSGKPIPKPKKPH
ncbi:hypothetical protein O181_095468 [Austropuccinia psidii MF-1]|uniref:Retrotransposon gag domain-containing protein n=1 Tax=Austropuccinia psidii MF-1 TaxID=1389203 RepID=A0A9Q3PB87_9BASI|nr:hypothetical protein [Austropuccinia psidii MF-1]